MIFSFLRTLVLAALLLLGTTEYFVTGPQAEELPRGRVVYCYDGDTLKLADGRKVRLAGIDTPEVAHKGEPAQLYAQEAADLLRRLTQGKDVRLRAATTEGSRDHYSRVLADVQLEDGSSVNLQMVRAGAAFVYAHKDNDPAYMRQLFAAQAEAMRDGRGMWGQLKETPVWTARYVGNKNSRRFFPADCAAVQDINPRNRVPLPSLEKAFAEGFAPARICPFWPGRR